MHCPPPPPPTSAEERHYDAQANQHVSRESALATRNAGVLIKYKKHANAVKRRQVDQYAGGANLLVDLGCGRGGDINKWCSSNIGNVVAMDLSSLQLSEARRRADQDPSCRKGSTAITWLHASMLQPDLLEFLRPKLSELADAVTVQFAIQFAFGSEETASRVLGVASSLLRDGGTLFGVAPDASAILELLDSKGVSTPHAVSDATDAGGSHTREVHLKPPAHPYSLLLQLPEGGRRTDFGTPLLFSLEDTVTAGSVDDECTEFLLFRDTLVRLAARHGLRPIEMESLADAAVWRGGKGGGGKGGGGKGSGGGNGLGPDERLVAGLYFTFAFVKDGGNSAPPTHARAERPSPPREGGRYAAGRASDGQRDDQRRYDEREHEPRRGSQVREAHHHGDGHAHGRGWDDGGGRSGSGQGWWRHEDVDEDIGLGGRRPQEAGDGGERWQHGARGGSVPWRERGRGREYDRRSPDRRRSPSPDRWRGRGRSPDRDGHGRSRHRWSRSGSRSRERASAYRR